MLQELIKSKYGSGTDKGTFPRPVTFSGSVVIDGRSDMKTARQVLADKWSGRSCTLESRPARILGRLLNYAIIVPVCGTGAEDDMIGVEFAWNTVDRIMSRDGAFKVTA